MAYPLMARLATELLRDVPGLTDRVFAAIVAEDETYATLAPERLAEVKEHNRRNILAQLTDLIEQRPPCTEASRETARLRAAQGFPLGALLHAYRIGFRVLWESLVERATADPGYPVDTLATSMTTIWTLVDAYSVAVTESYRETMVELTRHDERQRLVLLDVLIEGRVNDWTALDGSAQALGLPARGPYLCVVADLGTTMPRGSAWRLRTDDQVGVLSARSFEGLKGRVGVSPPYERLTETAAALRLAMLARASLPEGVAGVATVDARPVGALLAASPDLAERLAGTVLGPLLGRRDTTRLLEALETWLETGESTADLARRLYCHRNTVRNRLDRVEQLTGRSLERPEDVAALYTGVLALRLSGCAAAQ
ncbi:PucR family transcriptional regulator [Nonomuraea sp. bgisy101]|uniref:PucR family transcriptional regulator n=1 Tax=Nonomuraea sp. bgisy101 TaxID=3413784 RepID=UPI003D750515